MLNTWVVPERFSVDKMILGIFELYKSFDYFLLVAMKLSLDPSSQRDPNLNTSAFIGNGPLLFSVTANPNEKQSKIIHSIVAVLSSCR